MRKRGEGLFYLNNDEVTVGNLFKRLKELIGKKKDKLMVIRADRSVIFNKMAKVIDVAKAAGAGRLCLSTEKDF